MQSGAITVLSAMNYKFNIMQLDDHVGNGMLRYVKFVGAAIFFPG